MHQSQEHQQTHEPHLRTRIGAFCNDPIRADWRPIGHPRSNKYRRHAPSSNAAVGDARMAPFWLVP
jgi:hypothetical protein